MQSSMSRSGSASRLSAYGGGAATARGAMSRSQAPQPPLRPVLLPAGPVRQSSGAAAVAARSNENAMAGGRSTAVGCRNNFTAKPQVGGRVLRDITNTMHDHVAQEFRAVASPLRAGYEDAEAATEYLPEIVEQLFHQEACYQPDITAECRAALVDWLVGVHSKSRLKQITLFLTVHLLDKYLSRKAVLPAKQKLVGVVALLVAANFEELEDDVPKLEYLVRITDNTYSARDIHVMECHFLAALGFEVMAPTAHHFLELFSQQLPTEPACSYVASYLLELAMVNLPLWCHRPSKLAAAALTLAFEICSQTSGDRPFFLASGASVARCGQKELDLVSDELYGLMHAAHTARLQAVRRKYPAARQAADTYAAAPRRA